MVVLSAFLRLATRSNLHVPDLNPVTPTGSGLPHFRENGELLFEGTCRVHSAAEQCGSQAAIAAVTHP